MPDKVCTADSLVYIALRLDRIPTIMTEGKYANRVIGNLHQQKEEDKQFESEYLKAIDKTKRRIRELKKLHQEIEGDYRADFAKMLSEDLEQVVESYEGKPQDVPKSNFYIVI